MKKVKKPTGKYIIFEEEDGSVYSTDSPFWYNFFGGDIEGDQK